jgi:hypothetical protein
VLVAWLAHSLLAPVIEWASVAAGLHLVDEPWLLTLPALTVNTVPHLFMLATVAICTYLVLGWPFVAAEALFALSQAYRWLLPDSLPLLRDLCVATELALAAETQTVAINGATATHWVIVAAAVGAVWLIAIASGGVYVEQAAAAALTSACGCALVLQGLLAGGQMRMDCVGADRGMEWFLENCTRGPNSCCFICTLSASMTPDSIFCAGVGSPHVFTSLGGDAAGTSINLSALFVRTSPKLLLFAAVIGAFFQLVAVDGGVFTRGAVVAVPVAEEVTPDEDEEEEEEEVVEAK